MDDPNAVENMEVDNADELQPAMDTHIPESPPSPDKTVAPEALAEMLLELQQSQLQSPEPEVSSTEMQIEQPAKKPSKKTGPLPYTETISSGNSPGKRKAQEDIQRPAVPSNPNEDWHKYLFSPLAGTTTPVSSVINKLDRAGLSSVTATSELQKYSKYELENFTFLQEIIPNLFLGSLLALDSTALHEAGITRVLSVMSTNPHKEKYPDLQSNISREYIMMQDIKTFQSHPWYQTTSAIIDSALAVGERILIHCRMGVSRSATVVAAYLTFRHGLTPLQAVAWIKFQRPIVRPNSGFKEQLDDYYSVLQMDHGAEFGWRELSMFTDVAFDESKEEGKRKRRKRRDDIREKWKKNKVQWVKCKHVGWEEDFERLVQKHITASQNYV